MKLKRNKEYEKYKRRKQYDQILIVQEKEDQEYDQVRIEHDQHGATEVLEETLMLVQTKKRILQMEADTVKLVERAEKVLQIAFQNRTGVRQQQQRYAHDGIDITVTPGKYKLNYYDRNIR